MIAEFTQGEAFGTRSIAIWARERGTGDRVRIDVPDFRPYFYVEREYADAAREMDEVEEVVDYGFQAITGEEVVKVILESPGQTRTVRERFARHWESDVRYTMRFRIDVNLRGTFEIDDRMVHEVGEKHYRTSWTAIEPRPDDDPEIPKRNCYFDIEVGGHRQPQPNDDEMEPVTCLTAFDSYEDELHTWVWRDDFEEETRRDAFYDEVRDRTLPWTVRRFDDELTMIGDFMQWFKATDFDVLTGWYSDGFDVPYLMERVEDLGVTADAWSPMRQTDNGLDDYGQPKVGGIWMNDLMRRYASIEDPVRESLTYVANEEVGLEWEDHSDEIQRLWEEDPEAMIEYNATDVLATRLIDWKAGITDFYMDKMYSTGSQVEDIEQATRVTDYYHLFLADRDQKLPAKGQHDPREIAGAKVFTPESPGLLSPVIVLDLSKIYPNIMISLNLGYEKYEGRHDIVAHEEVSFVDELKARTPDDDEPGTHTVIGESTRNGVTYYEVRRTYHDGGHIDPDILGKTGRKNLWGELYTITAKGIPEKQFDWSFEDADIGGKLMPNGVRVEQEGEALTVEVLREMFDLREKYQRRAEQHEPGSEEYERLMNMRTVEKRNINAVYGAMLYTNFRLFRPQIGETVTFVGRNLLEMIRQVVEEYFEGHEVVYGDTDSVLIELDGVEGRDEIEAEGFRIEETVNDAMDDFAENFCGIDRGSHSFELEFEKVYEPMFIGDARKKYAGRKTGDENAGEDGGWGWLDEPTLDVTGFEYVRSDVATVTGEMQWDIFEEVLLRGGGKEDVRELVEDYYDRMVSGEIPIWDAVKSPSMNSWERQGAHVSAAKFTDRFFDDVNIVEGDTIYWIYVNETGYNHDHQKLPSNDKVAMIEGMDPPSAECRCDECGHVWWEDEFVTKIYNTSSCPECGASGADELSVSGCRVDWQTLADKEIRKKARDLLVHLGWDDIADELGQQDSMELFI